MKNITLKSWRAVTSKISAFTINCLYLRQTLAINCLYLLLQLVYICSKLTQHCYLDMMQFEKKMKIPNRFNGKLIERK